MATVLFHGLVIHACLCAHRGGPRMSVRGQLPGCIGMHASHNNMPLLYRCAFLPHHNALVEFAIVALVMVQELFSQYAQTAAWLQR